MTFSACLRPTEVELDISTNVGCSSASGTRITVSVNGADAAVDEVETQQCSAGEIGTLTVTPGGAQDPIVGIEVALAVGMALDNCRPPYLVDGGAGTGCIVARRALKYVSHTPLPLPIALDSDCLNVPCNASQTCKAGVCVSSMVDPGSCQTDAGCQLVDGGSPPVNATPVQIAAGESHACALMSDGTIRCWGDNTGGQLGTASGGTFSPVAVQVDTIHDATSISAGGQTTCALRTGGDVWCWGSDANGAVDGVMSTMNVATPTSATLTGASQVAVGATFTCASINPGGTSKCWGTIPSYTPTSGVFTVPHDSLNSTALACGTSACTEAGGTGIEWFGQDIDGQLTGGTNTGGFGVNNGGPLTEPVGGVAMGTTFGCSFGATTGAVTCWGDNVVGELGTGNGGTAQLPAAVPGLSNVTALGAGGKHACAVSMGLVSCWGDNSSGQLGVGDQATHVGPQPLTLSGVVGVASSTNATCVLAQASQGSTVTCWGSPSLVGDGTNATTLRLAPGAPVQLF